MEISFVSVDNPSESPSSMHRESSSFNALNVQVLNDHRQLSQLTTDIQSTSFNPTESTIPSSHIAPPFTFPLFGSSEKFQKKEEEKKKEQHSGVEISWASPNHPPETPVSSDARRDSNSSTASSTPNIDNLHRRLSQSTISSSAEPPFEPSVGDGDKFLLSQNRRSSTSSTPSSTPNIHNLQRHLSQSTVSSVLQPPAQSTVSNSNVAPLAKPTSASGSNKQQSGQPRISLPSFGNPSTFNRTRSSNADVQNIARRRASTADVPFTTEETPTQAPTLQRQDSITEQENIRILSRVEEREGNISILQHVTSWTSRAYFAGTPFQARFPINQKDIAKLDGDRCVIL